MSVRSVALAVAESLTHDRCAVRNEAHYRLFGHDFLHTLLGYNRSAAKDEQITAIYQAVMLAQLDSSAADRPWRDGGSSVTLEDIHRVILPASLKFLARFRSSKIDIPIQLSDEEVAEHFIKAVMLRRIFHNEFGRNFGDIPIEELKHMPYDRFQKLIPRMNSMYALLRMNLASQSTGPFVNL